MKDGNGKPADWLSIYVNSVCILFPVFVLYSPAIVTELRDNHLFPRTWYNRTLFNTLVWMFIATVIGAYCLCFLSKSRRIRQAAGSYLIGIGLAILSQVILALWSRMR